MTERESLKWGARLTLFFAALFAPQLSSGVAEAKEHCPLGMWASAESCCEPGTEYVASKKQCLVVRPERRCAQGHLDDCVAAARGLESQGNAGEGYAVELYRYACEEGHAPGCRGLAQLYDEGRGIERDPRRAMTMWEDACAQGDAPSCTTLAHQVAKQGAPDSRVLTLLLMACHRGDPAACGEYATSVSSHSANAAQKSKVATYLERACSGGVGRACRTLLDSERSEKEVSPAREHELLDRACRGQDAEACITLGQAAPYSAVRRSEPHRKD
jgi:TPR repeat protein